MVAPSSEVAPKAEEIVNLTALVTGAGGIMGATVERLAAAGVRMVLAGRDTVRLEAIAKKLEPAHLVVAGGDTTDPDIVAGWVERTLELGDGRIDVLLNGAGMQGPNDIPLWDLATKDFERTVATNLFGPFLTTRAVLPTMIAQRSGRIINVGGTFGLKGVAHRSHYSASKWGLRGLTRAVALEAGPFGITVNCLCPGYVQSKSAEREFALEAARECLPFDEVARRYAGGMALRRFVEADDLANAVEMLIGPGGRNITGQDIVVDAGAVV